MVSLLFNTHLNLSWESVSNTKPSYSYLCSIFARNDRAWSVTSAADCIVYRHQQHHTAAAAAQRHVLTGCEPRLKHTLQLRGHHGEIKTRLLRGHPISLWTLGELGSGDSGISRRRHRSTATKVSTETWSSTPRQTSLTLLQQ